MDGESLSGMYYPAARLNSPIVLLMHQFNENQHQWDKIALWLQNAPVPQANAGNQMISLTSSQTSPWLDPT